jgi:hypothetical protein
MKLRAVFAPKRLSETSFCSLALVEETTDISDIEKTPLIRISMNMMASHRQQAPWLRFS